MRDHLVRVWRKSPFEPEETADRTRLGERHQLVWGEGKTTQYNKHPTISERNPSNYTIPYEQPLDNNGKKKAILIWRNLSFANHLPALFNVLEDINTGKLNLSEEGWGTLTTVMFKIWCLHGCSWSDVPQRVCMCDINKEKMNYREQKG